MRSLARPRHDDASASMGIPSSDDDEDTHWPSDAAVMLTFFLKAIFDTNHSAWRSPTLRPSPSSRRRLSDCKRLGFLHDNEKRNQ